MKNLHRAPSLEFREGQPTTCGRHTLQGRGGERDEAGEGRLIEFFFVPAGVALWLKEKILKREVIISTVFCVQFIFGEIT